MSPFDPPTSTTPLYTRTFPSGTTGQNSWVSLHTLVAPTAGRYYVQVRTAPNEVNSYGSNGFGLRAGDRRPVRIDRKVSAFVKLPANYTSLYDAKTWWKIRYTTTSGRVTDRTTWSVSILGNPVHLVAEK